MQVDDTAASAPLVQVVHILGDDHHLIPLLQFRHGPVRIVGLASCQSLAPLVVEVQHQGGIPPPPFYAGHILHPVVFPQSVAVTEGRDATLGTLPRPCQKYDFLFHSLLSFSCYHCGQAAYPVQTEWQANPHILCKNTQNLHYLAYFCYNLTVFCVILLSLQPFFT